MHEAIYRRLREVAIRGDTICYADIAPLANLDMRHESDRITIGHLLGEISAHEYQEGGPLISAIVIRKNDQRPGSGFFTLAKDLGCLRPDQDEEGFWLQEVKQVDGYWERRAATTP